MTWPPRKRLQYDGPRQGRVRPRAQWQPPPQSRSAHLQMPERASFSASVGPIDQTSGWSDNPAAHLVLHKPPCGAPNCRELSMIWQRCGVCKQVFGRCHEHVSPDGREVQKARDDHGHWQGAK